jgi:isoleucyl-tRNA synthetase
MLWEKIEPGTFKEILGVSILDLECVVTNEDKIFDEVLVFPASELGAKKCERCWHWETDVGSNPEHPTICGRCVEAVKQFRP